MGASEVVGGGIRSKAMALNEEHNEHNEHTCTLVLNENNMEPIVCNRQRIVVFPMSFLMYRLHVGVYFGSRVIYRFWRVLGILVVFLGYSFSLAVAMPVLMSASDAEFVYRSYTCEMYWYHF